MGVVRQHMCGIQGQGCFRKTKEAKTHETEVGEVWCQVCRGSMMGLF